MVRGGAQAAADRLRALPGLRLGRLRDVTINYRHSGFLRLDPHLDPGEYRGRSLVDCTLTLEGRMC
mgnify:CR=1 FL=1